MPYLLSLTKSSCYGYSACSLACPLSLIRMTADTAGFLYLQIENSDACIHFKKCEKACPIINVEAIQIPIHNQQTYAAFVRDAAELSNSASKGNPMFFSSKIKSPKRDLFTKIFASA